MNLARELFYNWYSAGYTRKDSKSFRRFRAMLKRLLAIPKSEMQEEERRKAGRRKR